MAAVARIAQRATPVVDAVQKVDADDWATLGGVEDAPSPTTYVQPVEEVVAVRHAGGEGAVASPAPAAGAGAAAPAPTPAPRLAAAPASPYAADAAALQRGPLPQVPSFGAGSLSQAAAQAQAQAQGRPVLLAGAAGGASFFTPRVASAAALAASRDSNFAPPRPGCMVALRLRELDAMVPNALVTAPVVRVHLVDAASGLYIKKSTPARPAVTARGANAPTHIEPFQTAPYALGAASGAESSGGEVMVARWNEELVVDEDWDNLLSPTSTALALFEVLQPAEGYDAYRTRRGAFRAREGAYPVAWGYLRMRPKGGVKKHGDLNVRLREWTKPNLHKAVGGARTPPGVFEEFKAYRRAAWKEFRAVPEETPPPPSGCLPFAWCGGRGELAEDYPGVLRVTLTPRPRPTERSKADRALWPYQDEVGRLSAEQMLAGGRVPASHGRESAAPGANGGADGEGENRPDTRLHLQRGLGEPCQVPNRRAGFLESGAAGASAIAFSPDGSLIATAMGEGEADFSLRIYRTATLALEATYGPHYDLVYDLRWSRTGREVITASSDFTAKVWSVAVPDEDGQGGLMALRGTGAPPRVSMQHPGFVYAAAWCDGAHSGGDLEDAKFALTSCFDGLVRLWRAAGPEAGGIVAELSLGANVEAYGNAMALSPSGSRAYVGCGDGHVREVGIDTGGAGGGGGSLTLLRTFAALGGAPIAALAMHPNGEELVALSHASALVAISTTTMESSRAFWGVQCSSQRPAATQALCVSPDGAWLLAGSEDGRAILWSYASGESATLFNVSLKGQPLDSVAWSPAEHVFAMGAFGAAVEPEVHDWSPEVQEAAGALIGGEAKRAALPGVPPRAALPPLEMPAAPLLRPREPRKKLHLPDKLTPAMVRSMLAKVREDERSLAATKGAVEQAHADVEAAHRRAAKGKAPLREAEAPAQSTVPPSRAAAGGGAPPTRSSIPRLRPQVGVVAAKLAARREKEAVQAAATGRPTARRPLAFGSSVDEAAPSATRAAPAQDPDVPLPADETAPAGQAVVSGTVSAPPVRTASGSSSFAGSVIAPAGQAGAAERIFARLEEMKARAAKRHAQS